MFIHQIKYEWLQLVRDKWLVILFFIFIVLCLFAASNGKQKVALRAAEIESAWAAMQSGDEALKANIDSAERGLKTFKPWLNPKKLNVVGNRAPRVAAMPPKPLAFISTGQSDLYAHTAKPQLYTNVESYAASFTELSNPVQLMFGNFDLAFVLLYLLPLLVLALSYNLLSVEKEQGSLRLTLAQPVRVFPWLLNKMLLRFFLMTGIVWISLLLTFSISVTSLAGELFSVSAVLVLVALYIFFWFAVALIVNVFGKSSGANAVAVISVWTVLALLLPAIISQLANQLYPVPSRINLIHEMRVAKAEADRQADKILNSYYRDHPELAPRDASVKNQYEFYLKYFASQDVVRQAVLPVLKEYQSALKSQQRFAESLRFISPSLLLQDALNDIAGTSPRQYAAYRDQVAAFADSWRRYFLPRMFNNEGMQREDFDKLPLFSFSYGEIQPRLAGNLAGLTVFALLAVAIGFAVVRRAGVRVLREL
jgi:ABC-2 type transport system permease protein